MRTALPKQAPPTGSHRPRAVTVFAAAFVAGAAAAVGVNRALDVRLAQAKPRVESETIFVALRSLPQGATVTVWDVALREWPKAMMPATALRAHDTFSGRLLKHPLREGQPLLSIQLLPSQQGGQPAAEAAPTAAPADYTRGTAPGAATADADLWAPAEPVKVAALPIAQVPVAAQAPIVQPPIVPRTSEPLPAAAREPATAVAPPVAAPPAPEVVSPVEPTEQPGAVVAAEAATIAPTDTATKTDEPRDDTVAEVQPEKESDIASQAPVAQDPVAQDPVAQDPVAQDPVAQDPVAEVIEAPLPDDAGPSTNPEPASATTPTAAVEPTPAAVAAEPTPSATQPTAAARPAHGRYLVVPESIALKADSSFVKPADASPREAEGQAASQADPPSASTSVRPLPATTAATAGRNPQAARPQARAPQARPPQRQGRQSPPVAPPGNDRRPAGNEPSPQPRFGTTMFPNLSAGMTALEGRLRRDQPEQGEPPAASRPVTAR